MWSKIITINKYYLNLCIHFDTDMLSLRFVKLIGSPDDASLGFLRSNNARRYVRQLPQYPKQQFSDRFPNNAPGALDLLEKMLVFDPSRRITGIVAFFSVTIMVSSLIHSAGQENIYEC